jgi:hypothetical protein
MKSFLISFLILLSTVAFAIAQAPTPHVNPEHDPTAQPETITVHFAWYWYVIAVVAIAFFI